MKNNYYNIEFSHIYADAKFGEEQINSIKKLKYVLESLDKRKSYSTCILIDEFSPKKHSLNQEEFIDQVLMHGASVDFVCYESSLVKLAFNFIKEIPKSVLKIEKFNGKEALLLVVDNKKIGLIDTSGRPTCSLLIAIWTLVRLGIYELSKKDVKILSNNEFVGLNLITILPEKYKESESKVITILKSTKYNNFTKKIDYRFF